MKINLSKLIPSLILPLVIGLSSGFLTVQSINGWYSTINKPFLNPPNWIFGPVWTLLYLSMGLSLYIFWMEKKPAKHKRYGYRFFILQLLVNFLWSILFFNYHSPLVALIDIGLLIFLISLNIAYFWRINKLSAYILLPYLIWVCFAAYLNLAIFLIN